MSAAAEHFKGIGLIDQTFQAASPWLATGERYVGDNLPQVIAIGLHAIQAGFAQGIGQSIAGQLAIGGPTDHLGDHRIEERRDFAAGFYPGIYAQAFAIHSREVHRRQ